LSNCHYFLSNYPFGIDVISDVRDDLLNNEFKFNPSIVNEVDTFFQTIKQQRKKLSPNFLEEPLTFVSVHVRRTDYEHHMQVIVDFGGFYYSSAYFKQAMKYFRLHFTNVVFVVASDDIKWCEENISGDDVFFTRTTSKDTSKNQMHFDFVALAHCNNSIVSSGTFGIWSAYFQSDGGTHIFNGYEHSSNTIWPGEIYLNTPTSTWLKMDDPCLYMVDKRWKFSNSTNCNRFR
jgi:hypothetical protein